jgi:hypothetical protein
VKLSVLNEVVTLKHRREYHASFEDETVADGWSAVFGEQYAALVKESTAALNVAKRVFHAKAIELIDARLRELGVEPD